MHIEEPNLADITRKAGVGYSYFVKRLDAIRTQLGTCAEFSGVPLNIVHENHFAPTLALGSGGPAAATANEDPVEAGHDVVSAVPDAVEAPIEPPAQKRRRLTLFAPWSRC